jgi:hypothetical protein
VDRTGFEEIASSRTAASSIMPKMTLTFLDRLWVGWERMSLCILPAVASRSLTLPMAGVTTFSRTRRYSESVVFSMYPSAAINASHSSATSVRRMSAVMRPPAGPERSATTALSARTALALDRPVAVTLRVTPSASL